MTCYMLVGSKEFEGVIDASVKFVSTPLVTNSSGISENVLTVTMQDAGVQTNDDSVIQPVQRTIADEVDETSKALELPADDDDSDYGSDFEFSHDI